MKFNLPGMYEHFDLNISLLYDLKHYPEIFYPDVKIESFFGNFQFCIFDGGRIFEHYKHASKEKIEHIVEAYNEYDVAVRLIFTNNQLNEKHYYDRFSNLVLNICDNGKNEIVVNNNGLEKYLREKYPNFKYISSTTKCLNTKELFLDELKKDYDLICLDYNLNHNFNLLDSLTNEEKNKCEFLCNAICAPGCPSRKEHYRLNSISHLNYGKKYKLESCFVKGNTLSPITCNSKNYISPEEIYSLYKDKGFSHFKLEGRTLSFTENLCNYAKYLIKPEHQLEYISKMASYHLENYI